MNVITGSPSSPGPETAFRVTSRAPSGPFLAVASIVSFDDSAGSATMRLFDWVMVGGESGLGARPMHPDWVRSLQKQCEAAGAAFWFKQWGEWIPSDHVCDSATALLASPLFRDPRHYWSPRVNKTDFSVRVGTKVAGNLLDGKLYEERPTPRQRHDQTV